MRKFIQNRVLKIISSVAVVAGSALIAPGEGIPEPGLIMYGVIRNVYGGDNFRLSYGTLTWQFQTNGGPAITVSTALTNINDQFSYVLRVPCEAPIFGFPALPNTLKLTSVPTRYSRLQVSVNGNSATFVQPALATFTLSALDRGRIERVDLQTSFVPPDPDGNGLPDDWERQYFHQTGVDPFDDPDRDGMNNWAEYQAGTDPNNDQSFFRVIDIQPDGHDGTIIRWSSIAERNYAVERSSDLLTGFIAIQTNIPATPTINIFRDTNVSGPGQFFYRLRVER